MFENSYQSSNYPLEDSLASCFFFFFTTFMSSLFTCGVEPNKWSASSRWINLVPLPSPNLVVSELSNLCPNCSV